MATKLLTPPAAIRVGDQVPSLVGTWIRFVSRRAWWRMGPATETGVALDTDRVRAWLRITGVFAGDVNGPWQFEESDLRMMSEAFRLLGDDVTAIPHAEFHYLMRCISAIDAAVLSAPVEEPVAEDITPEDPVALAAE